MPLKGVLSSLNDFFFFYLVQVLDWIQSSLTAWPGGSITLTPTIQDILVLSLIYITAFHKHTLKILSGMTLDTSRDRRGNHFSRMSWRMSVLMSSECLLNPQALSAALHTLSQCIVIILQKAICFLLIMLQIQKQRRAVKKPFLSGTSKKWTRPGTGPVGCYASIPNRCHFTFPTAPLAVQCSGKVPGKVASEPHMGDSKEVTGS